MAGSTPEYGVTVSHDVMVAMRDGIRLSADIYRPALPDGTPAPGELPTILGRTSYDKANVPLWVDPVGKFFTRHGYATVIQDLRGRGQSEGVGQYYHCANVNEGADGYDTIEWIAAQPWSNGKVGMVGSSHGGIVQNVAALLRPPHLTALWVDVAPTSADDWEARQGGAMALQMFGALFLHAHDAPEIRDDPVALRRIEEAAENLRSLVWGMPFKPGHTPLSVVPTLEEVLFHYCRVGIHDDWWDMEALYQKSRLDRFADIPAVFSTGWFDPFADDVTRQFAHLAQQQSAPQRLLVGPWNHGGLRVGGSAIGEVDFGEAANWGNPVYNVERLRWFDRWLKDMDTGVEKDPPVRIFVMGGGEGGRDRRGHLNHGGQWRAEKTWPPSGLRETTYYLHRDGGLSTEVPDEATASVSWTHDPANPVPTIGASAAGFFEWVKMPDGLDARYLSPWARMRSIVPDGPMHQKERPGMVACKPPYPLLSERADVMVFQTPPLKRDIEVTGPMEVRLWVASSATDTDFTAKLMDIHPPTAVDPEGFHMLICDSILRARYRNGFDHEDLMVPEECYEIVIRQPPISNLFKAGHRIRLDIASSNFPRFDVNPNTGEPMGRHTGTIVARNILYLGRDHRSCIILPVVGR